MRDTGKFLPLRFYEDEEIISPNYGGCKGFDHREYFKSPTNVIPAFQVDRAVTAVTLMTCDEDIPLTLTFQTDVIDGVTYVSHFSEIVESVPAGIHVIKLTTSSPLAYYSDPIIFYETESDDPIYITYRGEVGVLGDIYWPANFLADAFVSAYIENPTYPILEDVREDENLNQHRVFQRWEKRYQIRFFGVESMADAMSLLPMMDEVYVNVFRAYNTIVNINWEEDRECLAEIIITFSTKEIVKTF